MIFLALLIALILGLVLYLYISLTFYYWQKRGVKVMKTTSFIFGDVTKLVFNKIPVRSICKDIYKECMATGERYMGLYFLYKPGLVVVDPELINLILKKDFNSFTDRPFYLNEKVDPLSKHLVSAQGADWKSMREQLTPAFTPSKLKVMFHTLLQVGNQLSDVFEVTRKTGECLKLKETIENYIMDTIGGSIFGIECDTLHNQTKDFKHFTSQVFGGNIKQEIKMMLSLLCPSVLYFFNIPFNTKETIDFYLKLTRANMEARKEHNIVRNDLFQSFLQLSDNQEKVLGSSQSDANLRRTAAQTLLFFGAAYETTPQTIRFAIVELINNEDVQHKLRKEILEVLARHNGEVTFQAINSEMLYLDMCIREVLRMFPGASTLARICTTEYPIPGSDLVIEKGTTVYIPAYEIQHDARYYPNPEKFIPERFESENDSPYMPMGDGPRACIGSRLSTITMKIFLVFLLGKYKFCMNSKTKLPLTLNKHSLILSYSEEIYLDMESFNV